MRRPAPPRPAPPQPAPPPAAATLLLLLLAPGAEAPEAPAPEAPPCTAESAPPPARRPRPGCLEHRGTGRCLPNFLVLGAQKSGTSTLYQLMRRHPQIWPARRKELHFFYTGVLRARCDPPGDRPDPQEVAEYAEHGNFPRRRHLENASAVTGEWSATYLGCWCCPAAVARVLPRVRLIAQLRDPVLRAHSRFSEVHEKYYLNFQRAGRGLPAYSQTFSMGFDFFALVELEHLRRGCLDENQSLSDVVRCASGSNIFGWGLYHFHLKLWLRHFDRRDLLVTYLEDLSVRPRRVMHAVEAHLGIEGHDYGEGLGKAYNPQGRGWEVEVAKPPFGDNSLSCLGVGIDSLVCRKLYDFYRPHMLELKKMADAGDIAPLPRSWIARWGLR